MSSIYLEDGYTATKTIPEVPGLHPALKVEYRPADNIQYLRWNRMNADASEETQHKNSCDLITSHIIRINGDPIAKDRVSKLRPVVTRYLLDLVLGYSPEDVQADLKNS
jgi:hypothetical protein